MIHNKFFQFVAGIFFIGLFVISPLAYFTGSTRIIAGKVIGLNAGHSQEGSYPYLIIKLDTNKTIQVNITKSSQYQKNRKVSIIERKTNFLGIKSYSFDKYID